jgi:preprotein translocase subunit SecF
MDTIMIIFRIETQMEKTEKKPIKMCGYLSSNQTLNRFFELSIISLLKITTNILMLF